MEDLTNFEAIVVLAVILSRLIVPLFIIRFPLPAIVACLIIDGVDQSIFQTLAPDAELAGYQSYDKALDIYYLVIAYIATLRNWTNQRAVYVARFLIFWRLVGVVFFELGVPLPLGLEEVLGERGWLFIFPNVFEYFFIFYESVRLFWDPRRMNKAVVIGAAAFIWIFIKLPQEWWIHIAQLDTTDFIKEDIFGVDVSTGWVDTFMAKPWIVVIAVIAVIAAAALLWWAAKRYLPPRDRPITIDADAETGREVPPERLQAEREHMMQRVFRPGLWEKYALIVLTTIIFAQMLEVHAEPVGLSIIVAVIIIGNAAISTAFERRGFGPRNALLQFVVTGVVNLGILIAVLLGLSILEGGELPYQRLGFLLLLMTLLTVLHDRYRPEYVARFRKGDATADEAAPAV